MKNKGLISTAIIVLLLAAGIYYYSNAKKDTPNTQKPVEEIAENTNETTKPAEEIERSDPEITSGTFILNMVAAAPPDIDNEALEKAVSFLSEGAKQGMGENPTASDLARFVGIQDMPDEGFVTGDISYKDNIASGEENGLAEAEITLKYSGGDTQRVFLLSKIGNVWQIDGIRQPEQK